MVEATGVPIGLVDLRPRRHEHGAVEPGQEGRGGQQPLRLDAPPGQARRRQGQGRALVPGRERRQRPRPAKVYPQVFADFIAAVRADFGQPELPFYFVQIGRFVTRGDPKGWNAVQDAQRRLPERVPNTAVVSVIDLELDDGIHVGTQGLKRAGQRLARIALRELFGQVGATTPTLDRVTRGPNNTLVVKFKGVNMAARGRSPGAA